MAQSYETHPAVTGGERQVLEIFLDHCRAQIREKASGLSDEQAGRHLVPSSTTIAGLLKHLAAVERSWFQRRLAGRDEADIGAHARGDDASWEVGARDSLAGLIADYDEACRGSRKVAAQFALHDTVPHPRLGQVSLRWIYAHMIEETARHAGHADILREQIDADRSARCGGGRDVLRHG